MRDIYHELAKSNFQHLTDEELISVSDVYSSAAIGISSALRLIGNLLLEAEISNEYTGDEARRDLNLAGCALRTLPRLAQALEHNADYAKYEHSKRCTKGSV